MPEGNQFLQDQKKALALIGKIIGGRKTAPEKKRTNLFRRIDRLIDEQLLDTLNEAGLEEELAFSERLRLLSDKIDQLGKFELLEHKAIIGVGGQFSAGKSTFINSLIGKEAVLPQNVSVTTSISTYIVCGEKHQNSAYTTNHQFVMLADEEYKALTHEFTKRYVGFSRFVDNIILERPDFSDNIVAMSDTGRNSSDLWKNVAFLDTPGYNKARDRQQEQFTDRKQAARQLENVDFVIWLLAVENGDLSESDIDFLWDSLGRKLLEYPERVLVVINKAKKKPDDMVKEILGQIKETLCGAGISEKCLVTAYDSFAREELFGQTHIIDFLKKAATGPNTTLILFHIALNTGANVSHTVLIALNAAVNTVTTALITVPSADIIGGNITPRILEITFIAGTKTVDKTVATVCINVIIGGNIAVTN